MILRGNRDRLLWPVAQRKQLPSVGRKISQPWDTRYSLRGYHRPLSSDRTEKNQGTTGTECGGVSLRKCSRKGASLSSRRPFQNWRGSTHRSSSQEPVSTVVGTHTPCALIGGRHRQRQGEIRSRRTHGQAGATALPCL